MTASSTDDPQPGPAGPDPTEGRRPATGPASATAPALPARSAARRRALARPAVVRCAGMSVAALRDAAGTAYAQHVQRDPMARLFALGRGNPYPLYDELREGPPVGRSSLGIFYTTDHAITSTVLTSRQWGAQPPGPEVGPAPAGIDLSILSLNPPDHTRLRRIAAPAFGRRRMEGYRDRILARLDRLLDQVPADRPWDLVPGLAAPLPITVITDLLGIHDYDEATFLRFGRVTGAALDGIRSPAHAAALVHAEQRLGEVFTRLFELRSREPADDVISAVVSARHDEKIAPEDMVPLCRLLLIAGFETTVNLIGSAVALLLHRPDQWQMLVDDPTLAAGAVEETLRYFPPVHVTSRHALAETEVGGHVFPAGATLLPVLAAANRDPAVFTRPDVFDITRSNAGEHLAFSAGAHYCLGAPLARLEATLALEALARRLPDLRLAGPILARRGITLRGPERLLVANHR